MRRSVLVDVVVIYFTATAAVASGIVIAGALDSPAAPPEVVMDTVAARPPDPPPALEERIDSLRGTGWWLGMVRRVAAEEGFVDTTYADTGGTVAIGYGTNLSTGGINADQQRICMVSDHPSMVTETQARCLLETGLAYRWLRFAGDETWVLGLPGPVQAGLADMAYELGVSGLEGFTRMLDALRMGDYETAANSVRGSRWYREVPGRAGALVGILLAHIGSS